VALHTRLTQQLGIVHPVISAPMAFAADGQLAAAVSTAEGLGLIGGGYGDAEWLQAEFSNAGNAAIGCGFITWSLKKQPQLLDRALAHSPRAIFLSFGDPEPFAARIKGAGAKLICQVQTRRDAERAIGCAADIVVAQGAEAGGHGERRATMTLVPEVADLIAAKAPETLLCAAGGIGDGRGLAAALMLGADGVLVGSRLWASSEANVSPAMHAAALGATGDDTIRSQVMDLARKLDWPVRYSARVLRNAFIDRWHGREPELAVVADEEAAKYRAAWAAGDPEGSNTFVGEVAGLIHAIEPAGVIIKRMVHEAERKIARCARDVVSLDGRTDGPSAGRGYAS
jgi:nitronate monooxygenase